MHWKESESTAALSKDRIKETLFFENVMTLPVDFAVWELATGVSEEYHVHNGDVKYGPLEELYYCMEGEGVMWIDGEDVPVAAGDAVLAPARSYHGLKNTGSVPLKLVLIWGTPTEIISRPMKHGESRGCWLSA